MARRPLVPWGPTDHLYQMGYASKGHVTGRDAKVRSPVTPHPKVAMCSCSRSQSAIPWPAAKYGADASRYTASGVRTSAATAGSGRTLPRPSRSSGGARTTTTAGTARTPDHLHATAAPTAAPQATSHPMRKPDWVKRSARYTASAVPRAMNTSRTASREWSMSIGSAAASTRAARAHSSLRPRRRASGNTRAMSATPQSAPGSRQPQGPSPSTRMPAATASLARSGWATERRAAGFHGSAVEPARSPRSSTRASCT